MEIRKLRKEEHDCTRALWEEIFPEDTKEFLDYYYSVKVAENEIYVIEEDDRIVSMLHLNPYEMRVKEQIYHTHYIVAVATDVKYRRRGYMATLLNHVMKIMQERGEPFTFLMPASEAIYKPFGFTFIYEQGRSTLTGKCINDDELVIEEATEADCGQMADFANAFLKEHDVVTWRSAEYYRVILEEQKSEKGGILLVKRNGRLQGVLCYAREEELEIREPLCEYEADLEHAIFYLAGGKEAEVVCVGYGGEERKPLIMAKVLQPEFDMELKNAKVFLNEVV